MFGADRLIPFYGGSTTLFIATKGLFPLVGRATTNGLKERKRQMSEAPWRWIPVFLSPKCPKSAGKATGHDALSLAMTLSVRAYPPMGASVPKDWSSVFVLAVLAMSSSLIEEDTASPSWQRAQRLLTSPAPAAVQA